LIRRISAFAFAATCILTACGHSDGGGLFFYAVPTGTSTPAPGAVVPSPGALSLYAPGQTATFAVTQANNSGTFTAVSSNPAIAAVAPGSTPASFVVTAGSTAGVATITVTGLPGEPTGAVAVTVTITQGVVQ
jgi:hypothetical protein